MDICEYNICNYTTKKQGDYNRHIKTDKHLNKVTVITKFWTIADINNIYIRTVSHEHFTDTSKTPINNKKLVICIYCCMEFSRTGSLTKHKKICSDKHNTEKN